MAELFIDGTWRDARRSGARTIYCPADGTPVATVSEAEPPDTVDAIRAARRAFDDGRWSRRSAADRCAVLDRTADLLERDRDRYARAESLDTGKRLVESEQDLDDVIAVFRHYAVAGAADHDRRVDTDSAGVISRVVREPVGVCGLITPWNYPLLQTSWKVAPCLAAGNTLVLKPSELTPSTAVLLMGTLTEAGVPDGVANLVLGAGPEHRCRAGRRSRRRPDQLHRRIDHRTTRDGARGRHGEADRAGARREESQHHLRRRRPGHGPRLRPDRGVPAFRAGVLGRHPPAAGGARSPRSSPTGWSSGPGGSGSAARSIRTLRPAR